jgi:hypothetical protein
MEAKNWTYTEGTTPHFQSQVYDEQTGQTVAVIYNDEGGKNASLIAASPDMLEALILAYSFMVTDPQHQGRNILETMKQAINKATRL